MDTITEENFHVFLQQCIIKSYERNENIFDLVINSLEEWYDGSAHSLMEIKMKESKKTKGTHFELLCKAFLQHGRYKYSDIRLLHELPEEERIKLNLKTRDFGIDIICKDYSNNYHAVQCKYRKVNRMKKNIITWAKLSTFYALCLKTGPWAKYIVMTNADYVTHMGPKTEKDLSICIGTWRKIPKDTWYLMAEMTGSKESSKEPVKETITLTKEELRKKRLEFLDKL